MKVTVLTPRFNISGVPLAQMRLARALAAQGHDVDLLIGTVNEGSTKPSVDGVRVLVLGKRRVAFMLGPIARHLRRSRPDVVFTAEDHLTAVTLIAAALVRSRAKISGSSRVSPFDTYGGRPLTKRWMLKHLMRHLMPRASVLTCVSEDMVHQYRAIFPDAPHVPVYNIVVDATARSRIEEPVDEPWFTDGGPPALVSAGSLVPWKGFSDLLKAMQIVVQQRPARLLLLGDGALRSQLQEEARTLGLAEAVKFVGFVENPLKYFARAKAFVLSSHIEGLPNVLVEAMMCGCTVVATNCPTGPREVLDDGKYGILVPMRDPPALAAGILAALDRPTSKALLEEAVRPFSEDVVLRRHFALLGLGSASAAVPRSTAPDL